MRDTCIGVGLINIMSTNNYDGFKYYLVDEKNKNLALGGNRFEYYASKSNDVASTCVKDSTPTIRIPSIKAYIVARSTNILSDTNVKFQILMKSEPAPYTRIYLGCDSTTSDGKYLVGKGINLVVEFLNDESFVDTMQKGNLEFEGVNYAFDGGKKEILFVPSKSGQLVLSVRYVPDSSVIGNPVTVTKSIVVQEQDSTITFLWNWIVKDKGNMIISIVVLCGILIGVLVLCIVGVSLIIWWRRRKRVQEKLKYESVDDQ